MPIIELLNIYILCIRSLVEQSSVVWNSSITQEECLEIERVQKVALRIIMNENYVTYANALCITGLMTLKERRDHLSQKFAKKCTKSDKSSHMFPLNGPNIFNTRNHETYFVTPARTSRLANSAIPSMQRKLNSWHAIECYSNCKCKPWIIINCIMDNKPLSHEWVTHDKYKMCM